VLSEIEALDLLFFDGSNADYKPDESKDCGADDEGLEACLRRDTLAPAPVGSWESRME
jgi:hypothetical protein